MKLTLVLAALAVVVPGCGGGGSTYPDDPGTGSGGTPAARCDMKVVVDADWCATCKTFCGANCPVDANGNCKACGKATVKAKACIRSVMRCSECRTNHNEPCKLNSSYQCCTPAELKSRLVCGGCGQAQCAGAACEKCKAAGGCKPRCLH